MPAGADVEGEGMRRAVLFVVGPCAALGLAACGGGSSGGSASPDDAMATFTAAVLSGNWSGACAVAEPSEQADCNTTLTKVGTEKVTFKNFSYTISNVGSSTAEAKLHIRACVSGQCESNTTAGELVKQNGSWYVSNSTGAFGQLCFWQLREQLNTAVPAPSRFRSRFGGRPNVSWSDGRTRGL